MTTEELKTLAEEAVRTAYDPRAQRCWPWSHAWTMWKEESRFSYFQRRRCVKCGKIAAKFIYS